MQFDWKTWFIEVWEENRNLTNNVIRALAEANAMDKVLVEGMRPFRDLALEIFSIEQWNIRGLAYEEWEFKALPGNLRTGPIEEILEFGNSVRNETRKAWGNIPFDSFTQLRSSPAPFIPEGNAIGWLTYALENEIHHRGQGYVYLRLLGQEPPEFYIRTK